MKLRANRSLGTPCHDGPGARVTDLFMNHGAGHCQKFTVVSWRLLQPSNYPSFNIINCRGVGGWWSLTFPRHSPVTISFITSVSWLAELTSLIKRDLRMKLMQQRLFGSTFMNHPNIFCVTWNSCTVTSFCFFFLGATEAEKYNLIIFTRTFHCIYKVGYRYTLPSLLTKYSKWLFIRDYHSTRYKPVKFWRIMYSVGYNTQQFKMKRNTCGFRIFMDVKNYLALSKLQQVIFTWFNKISLRRQNSARICKYTHTQKMNIAYKRES